MEASVETVLKVKGSVVSMTCSNDGKLLVITNAEQNITVYDLSKDQETCLPNYDSPVTAVGINPFSKDIIVVYANSMIMEYSILAKKYTKFCKMFLNKKAPKALSDCLAIRNVSFDSETGSLILFHDDSSIIVLDKEGKSSDVEPQQQNKVKRRELSHKNKQGEEDSLNNETLGKFNFVQRSHQILYFSHVKGKSVISVEVDPVELHDRLPPTFRVKKYGGV